MATKDKPVKQKTDKEKQEFEKDLREMFDLFDTDGDKSISVGEFGKVLRKMGFSMTNTEVKTAIKKIDSNSNGKVEYGEFRSFMMKQFKETMEDPDTERECRQAFKLFDRNGNGSVDKQEIRKAMKTLGQSLSENEINMMMKEADKNKDGKIDYDEFRIMWKQKTQE